MRQCATRWASFDNETDEIANASKQWSSVEVVLWGEVKNNPNTHAHIPKRTYPGYGRYLVAAEAVDTSGNTIPFNSISNNCCFGAFTYQYDSSNITNPHRELDMMECSRIWEKRTHQCTIYITTLASIKKRA